MCRSGDLFPQPVTSVYQLLAVAHAMARATETRYRALAEPTWLNGDVGLKPLFVHLAENAGRHVGQITQRSQSLCGRAPDPALVRQPLPRPFDEEAAHSALLTPYQALANAVIDEERVFAFHTYIAAQAPDGPVRRLAEEFAREKLNHAALLRQERRQAFHAQRPRNTSLPQTIDDLHALALEGSVLASQVHAALARRLAAAGNIHSAGVFRHLAEDEAPGWVNLLDERRSIGTKTIAEGVQILEQAFECYIDIARRAESEPLMAEAQRLAEHALRRLILARSAQKDAPASMS